MADTKITVSREKYSHDHQRRGRRVKINGQPSDFLVVEPTGNSIGRTILDRDGDAITAQHIGISPGDLARLVIPRHI